MILPRIRTGEVLRSNDELADIRLDSASGDALLRSNRLLVAALVTLGALSTLCWLALLRWYSVLDHADNTHFAFEKVPGGFGSSILRRTELLFLGIALLYVLGFIVLRRASGITRSIQAAIVFFALGPAIINVLLYPVGALDVFNYMIELKLAFHFDQNPYLVTFESYRDDPFALPAFLVDVPLFYGPAWLLISGLPALIVGFDDVLHYLLALKCLNLLLLTATAYAIYRHQHDAKRGWLAAYLFAANPLVLFEGLANAHNDVTMTVFLVGAVVALERKSVATAPLLGLSILVKFFTGVLAPVLIIAALKGGWRPRRLALSGTVMAAIAVLLVAPYWAGGDMIDGLKRGTEESQEMDHVSPYSLAQQYLRTDPDSSERIVAMLSLPPEIDYDGADSDDNRRTVRWALQSDRFPRQLTEDEKDAVRRGFTVLFVAATVLVLWRQRRGTVVERTMVYTLLLFSLFLTNFYPWYLIPVFALLALHIDRIGIVYLFIQTALGLAYYPLYVWAHFESGYSKLQVHLFLALFLTAPVVAFLAAEAVKGLHGSRPTYALRRAKVSPAQTPAD